MFHDLQCWIAFFIFSRLMIYCFCFFFEFNEILEAMKVDSQTINHQMGELLKSSSPFFVI